MVYPKERGDRAMKIRQGLVSIAIVIVVACIGSYSFPQSCHTCRPQGDGGTTQTGNCYKGHCVCDGYIDIVLEDNKCNGSISLVKCVETVEGAKRHNMKYVDIPTDPCGEDFFGSDCHGGCVVFSPGMWVGDLYDCHYEYD